jgi:hypothetical protein
VKIADFGFNPQYDPLKPERSIYQVVHFLSPELLSMGAILYSLIFGDYPFKGETNQDVINQILTGFIPKSERSETEEVIVQPPYLMAGSSKG